VTHLGSPPFGLHPLHGVHEPTTGNPLRRPRSARRTTSIDMTRDEGSLDPVYLNGRARDLWTAADFILKLLGGMVSRPLPRLLTVTVAAAVGLSSVGCAGIKSGPTAQSARPKPTSASVSANSPAASGVSNGKNYALTIVPIDGTTPDGAGRWHALVGRLSGGDTAVAEAFNQSSEASAHQQIDHARSDADGVRGWNFELKSAVTFRPNAIGELVSGVSYTKGAAHPTDYVSTVVIDSRTARPITLSDLFSDQQSGLDRLSEQTKLIWPEVYSPGGAGPPMLDEPGNRPVPQNFANWIPTTAGIELHFADGQFGHGLPVITVPWSTLSDVLAPDMKALAQG
jgi:hypothetical protein